jgi:glycolate oxidase FAD binding subunit
MDSSVLDTAVARAGASAPGEHLDPALRRCIDQVQTALAQKAAVQLRGGGTKAFLGGLPEGELLDTRPLAGISAYEPSELVVTARAGTSLAELEAVLAEKGQALPFEPPRLAGGGTVGGMVAAGLAGPARAAVGGVRDYVLGATLLNGRAELLSFGGQVMKNVAGYDVSRALAGSMGVLGLICEVSLKVLPQPMAQATLRFECDQSEALQRLNQWAGQPLPLNASAWWQGTLLLRLAGAAAAVQSACTQLGGERLGDDAASAFWAGLRDQRDEFFEAARRTVQQQAGHTLWRFSLPATAPVLALPEQPLVEWGGAQRWACNHASLEQMQSLARSVGGSVSRWWGGDRAQMHRLKDHCSPAVAQVQRRLKAAFDPEGVFNRGRLFCDF